MTLRKVNELCVQSWSPSLRFGNSRRGGSTTAVPYPATTGKPVMKSNEPIAQFVQFA